MKKILVFILFLLVFIPFISAADEKMIYKSVSNRDMKIALSFDDGPHPEQTEDILSILNKYNVKATFFVVGQNADYYPDILRQVVEEGHEIGNHTYSHINILNTDKQTIKQEISRSHNNILEICEYEVKLFRPPGGALNQKVTDVANSFGYKIILWDIDTKDWSHKSVDLITENVIKNIKSGSIILFHDYISKGTPTPEALENIIPLLQKEGYTFVTVGELLECEQETNTH